MEIMDPAQAYELAALSRAKVIEETSLAGDSEVQRFYAHSAVFVTGATGFLGKQLVEKLLRSCDISNVFILIRSKKGKTIKQRLGEMLQDPVFDMVKRKKPDFASKIECVEGDVTQLRLGISQDIWDKITKQINTIFHVAATTRFDESLRTATLINVRGTREVLLLASACKNLSSYVHVSTAYTHAKPENSGQEVFEKFYQTPISPEALISLAEDLEDDRLQNITENLIKDWPNTYTFTKAVAEELIRTSTDGLPICIVRPAVVISAYREPTPGWLDMSCIYGATGLIITIGLGVSHVYLGRSESKLSFIPCDFVTNAIIVAGRETAVIQKRGGESTTIYTVATPKRNPCTIKQFHDVLTKQGKIFPTPKCVYYNFGYNTQNEHLYFILATLLHIVPAYIVDLISVMLGKEKRFVNLAKKFTRMSISLKYFLINDWIFEDNNLLKLYNNMSEKDKVIYNFNIDSIDWTEYVTLWMIGIRKYIIKDGLKNTNYAVKKQFYLKLLHYCICCVLLYYVFKGFYAIFTAIY